MTKTITADLCVIGAGSAGLSLSAGAAQLGLDVVLLEKGDMGGDCLNVGCVPSKALIAAGKAAKSIRAAGQYGITVAGLQIDYAAAMAHVHKAIAEIAPMDSAERYEGFGCTVIRAQGRFTGPDAVTAAGTVIKARRYVIATGSRPVVPPVPGLKDSPYLTNETLWRLTEAPKHLLVMGGGAIGVEMAQAHRRLGCEVTLFDMGPILPRDDPEAVAVVRDQLRAEGVSLIENAKLTRVETSDGGEITCHLQAAGDGAGQTVTGSHLLVAAGRQPVLDGLDMDKAGVTATARGVEVNHALQTKNPKIFAIGDAIGGGFTHVAGHHAEVLIKRLLFKLPTKINTAAIPHVTYTDPELAQLGLTEATARDRQGEDMRVLRWSLGENDRAIAEGRKAGFVKVITTKKGRVLGVTLVGDGAGEFLTPWSLMIDKKLKLSAMTGVIVPYPTRAEISKRAAGTFFADMVFNPKTRKIVRFLFRIF